MAKAEKKEVAEQPKKTLATPSVDPFSTLRSEVDRVFDNFFGKRTTSLFPTFGFEELARPFTSAALPSVDVKEVDSSLNITAELPGMKDDDVEISVRDGVLTLKGEKKEETSEEKEDLRITERRYGSFQRSFRLPEGAEEENIAAVFDKGVLTITVPKSEVAEKSERKISIGKG